MRPGKACEQWCASSFSSRSERCRDAEGRRRLHHRTGGARLPEGALSSIPASRSSTSTGLDEIPGPAFSLNVHWDKSCRRGSSSRRRLSRAGGVTSAHRKRSPMPAHCLRRMPMGDPRLFGVTPRRALPDRLRRRFFSGRFAGPCARTSSRAITGILCSTPGEWPQAIGSDADRPPHLPSRVPVSCRASAPLRISGSNPAAPLAAAARRNRSSTQARTHPAHPKTTRKRPDARPSGCGLRDGRLSPDGSFSAEYGSAKECRCKTFAALDLAEHSAHWGAEASEFHRTRVSRVFSTSGGTGGPNRKPISAP